MAKGEISKKHREDFFIMVYEHIILVRSSTFSPISPSLIWFVLNGKIRHIRFRNKMKFSKACLLTLLPIVATGISIYKPEGHHKSCKTDARCVTSKL